MQLTLALINNSDINLHEVLGRQLKTADTVDIHVAYLMHSGVRLLEPELRHFLGRGHRLRVLAGGDLVLSEL